MFIAEQKSKEIKIFFNWTHA